MNVHGLFIDVSAIDMVQAGREEPVKGQGAAASLKLVRQVVTMHRRAVKDRQGRGRCARGIAVGGTPLQQSGFQGREVRVVVGVAADQDTAATIALELCAAAAGNQDVAPAPPCSLPPPPPPTSTVGPPPPSTSVLVPLPPNRYDGNSKWRSTSMFAPLPWS